MGMTEDVDTFDYEDEMPPNNPTTPLDQFHKAAVMKYNNMVATPVVLEPRIGNKRKREGGGQRKENQLLINNEGGGASELLFYNTAKALNGTIFNNFYKNLDSFNETDSIVVVQRNFGLLTTIGLVLMFVLCANPNLVIKSFIDKGLIPVLIKEIQETLEQTGHQAHMKKHMENAEAMQTMFKYIPVPFYIL